jgi:hypothetical protein
LGVTSKPNQSAITSKSNPDEDDNASLMIEDDPNDSSFGEMSFDMDALEEAMKMYD